MVGETGFEPATLCSQSKCATGLRHSPHKYHHYFMQSIKKNKLKKRLAYALKMFFYNGKAYNFISYIKTILMVYKQGRIKNSEIEN